jgi:hypothetical protein
MLMMLNCLHFEGVEALMLPPIAVWALLVYTVNAGKFRAACSLLVPRHKKGRAVVRGLLSFVCKKPIRVRR